MQKESAAPGKELYGASVRTKRQRNPEVLGVRVGFQLASGSVRREEDGGAAMWVRSVGERREGERKRAWAGACWPASWAGRGELGWGTLVSWAGREPPGKPSLFFFCFLFSFPNKILKTNKF